MATRSISEAGRAAHALLRARWRGPATVFLALFLACYLPVACARANGLFAMIWPANALALVILLRARQPNGVRWDLAAAAAAACAAANLAGGMALGATVLFTIANAITVASALAFVRAASLGARQLSAPRALARLAAACLIAPAAGALLAGAGLALTRGADFARTSLDWYLLDAVSMMVVAPIGLLSRAPDIRRLLSVRAPLDWAICVGLPAAATVLAMNFGHTPALFLVSPAIVAAALRLRAAGLGLALTTVAAVGVPAVLAAPHDLAPFSYAAARDRLISLQCFFLVQTMVCQVVIACLAARDDLMAALAAQREKAVAAADAKTRVLMDVSHEIRTPLNVILALSELMERRGPAGDDARLRANITAAARDLHLLAQDVLNAAALESGALGAAPQWMAAAPALEESVAMARAAFEAPRTQIQIECPPEARLWADPARFRQVARNLISNAVKYAGDFGPIIVRLRSVEGACRLEVHDRGPGFAPGAALAAFEAFASHRVADARSAGVGLSIVKQIAELHGGRVGVYSAPHVDTCVWIELPDEDSPGAAAARARRESAAAGDPDRAFAAA
ncbi:MAG: ATP-binding protein [Hyphomonadaceae bacterium]